MIGAAALTAVVLALAGGPAVAVTTVPDPQLSIGAPVAAWVTKLGAPVAVTSADSGHRFLFSGGQAAYTDDDGLILAVELQAGSISIAIDGRSHHFAIGRYTLAQADAELAEDAEFAGPALRSYRLAPRRDLVFGFEPASNRLERVTFGEPGQLVRLGLLPGDVAARAVAYRAPRPVTLANAPATGPNAIVYRLTIDRAGAVRDVGILFGPATPAQDATFSQALRRDRYTAATLGGRPIRATVFSEQRY